MKKSVKFICTPSESLQCVEAYGHIQPLVDLSPEKSPLISLGGRMFELHSWSEGRRSKLHSVCRESVHRILNRTAENCTVCVENPRTEFLIARLKTAQCVWRIRAQNS